MTGWESTDSLIAQLQEAKNEWAELRSLYGDVVTENQALLRNLSALAEENRQLKDELASTKRANRLWDELHEIMPFPELKKGADSSDAKPE